MIGCAGAKVDDETARIAAHAATGRRPLKRAVADVRGEGADLQGLNRHVDVERLQPLAHDLRDLGVIAGAAIASRVTSNPLPKPASSIMPLPARCWRELAQLVLGERPFTVAWRNGAGQRGAPAINVVDDLLTVDGQVDRLPNTRIPPGNILCGIELNDAWRGEKPLQNLQRFIVLQGARHIGRQGATVNLAGAGARRLATARLATP